MHEVTLPGSVPKEAVASQRRQLEEMAAELERRADDFSISHSHASWQDASRALAQRRAFLEEELPVRQAELLSYKSEWQSKSAALREQRQAAAALEVDLKGTAVAVMICGGNVSVRKSG